LDFDPLVHFLTKPLDFDALRSEIDSRTERAE
jgi:hypothetical protein